MEAARTPTKPADSMSLADARFEAQKLVFGPLLFQATRLLRAAGLAVERESGIPGVCSLLVCHKA